LSYITIYQHISVGYEAIFRVSYKNTKIYNGYTKCLNKTTLPLIDGLRKTQKNKPSHDGWCAGRDMNPEPSKHAAEIPTTAFCFPFGF
jgi:hypothetical protein